MVGGSFGPPRARVLRMATRGVSVEQAFGELSGEAFLADGEGGDAVETGSEADAGAGGDVDSALGRHSDFGIDDVFVPVALAGRDIAGERKVG